MANIYPKNYKSKLTISETQEAITVVKSTFEKELASRLGLIRASAPIFLDPKTGLNDNLSGDGEDPVNFTYGENKQLEIVQSLAKWKRYALKKYEISGLYTDMNAIRKNETLDNFHSLYVDQWDWEKVITKNQRKLSYLKEVVDTIYSCLVKTEEVVNERFPLLTKKLPKNITFISSQAVLDLYPNLSPEDREKEITKQFKAVFIYGIGCPLSNGKPHGNRASDYDDWTLNGDLLVWDELLDTQLELSSMGIRVDGDSLLKQLMEKKELSKTKMEYHQLVINNILPLTIGGGIGQSRLSMFLLEKAHIGEVQSSYWDKSDIESFKKSNIFFL